MSKKVILVLVLSLIFFLVFATFIVAAQDYPAITIVEKKVINDVIALELNIPAKYELKIRNNQLSGDDFEIYSLLDVILTPLGTFYIEPSTASTITATVMPRAKQEGRFGITYFIRGEKAGSVQAKQDSFVIHIMPFSDIVGISIPEVIDRESTKLRFKISNPEKIDLGKGTVTVESEFFDLEKEVDLSPGASQEINVNLKDLHGLNAEDYTIEFKFDLEEHGELIAERDMKIIEVLKITESDFKRTGLLSYVRTLEKKNDGNVPQYVKLEMSQFFLESIFSRYDKKPDYSYYIGLNHKTSWQKELQTGETLSVKATIDYTIPVLILIALIVAFVWYKLSKRPRIILRKKLVKVKTTGGEFALKIVLIVKNIGNVAENITIIDRIPIASNIHERFGAIKPDKVEKGRLVWKFEKLMPGEEHILSYVVYSKAILIGKINIPLAIAHYTDVKGQRKIAYSSKLSVIHEIKETVS